LCGYSSAFIFHSLQAAIKTEKVEYRHGAALLEGYIACDDAVKKKAPGVLIVHDWTGVGKYVKNRAEQIAGLGYVAFAIDMYGEKIRPKNSAEASKEASIYRNDRKLMRTRALAGLKELQKNPLVDSNKIAVMGYCFGGGVALELARSGAALLGAASFHGNLDTPLPAERGALKAKILVLHGADDPNVPPEQVTVFEDEMRKARADWQLVKYGNAVHSFTNPDSGKDSSKGSAYNREADQRSWLALKAFFMEIFGDSEK